MNSKEALEKWFNTISIQDKIRWEENYKLINKDLEILDILKKHYDNNSLALSLNSFIVFSIHKNDKDFNKIKEWLKDEQ